MQVLQYPAKTILGVRLWCFPTSRCTVCRITMADAGTEHCVFGKNENFLSF